MATETRLSERLEFLDRLSEASMGGRAMSLEEGLELARAHGVKVSAAAVEEALAAPQPFPSPAPIFASSENEGAAPKFAWTPDWNRPDSLEDLEHERQTGEEALKELKRIERSVVRAIMGSGILIGGSFLFALVMAALKSKMGLQIALWTDLGAALLVGAGSQKITLISKKQTKTRERLEKLESIRPYRTELNQWKSEPRLVHHLQQCLTSTIGLRMGDVQDLRKAWMNLVCKDDTRASPEDLAALLPHPTTTATTTATKAAA